MGNNYFEKFIEKNRQAFDDESPSKNVWANIEKNLPVKKQAKVFSLKDVFKWSAAAAVLFILLTSVYFLFIHKSIQQPETAHIQVPEIKSTPGTPSASQKDTDTIELGSIKSDDLVSLESKNQVIPDVRDKVTNKVNPNEEPSDMFKIIATKQAELKTLTKEQPYLYQEFTADLRTLESSYGVLKKQLKQTGNSDVIIKAMMQNLQLQAELLGRQLSIINKIKTDKKNEKVNSHYN